MAGPHEEYARAGPRATAKPISKGSESPALPALKTRIGMKNKVGQEDRKGWRNGNSRTHERRTYAPLHTSDALAMRNNSVLSACDVRQCIPNLDANFVLDPLPEAFRRDEEGSDGDSEPLEIGLAGTRDPARAYSS